MQIVESQLSNRGLESAAGDCVTDCFAVRCARFFHRLNRHEGGTVGGGGHHIGAAADDLFEICQISFGYR